MVTGRPTRIHTQAKGRYYLRAHFKASPLSREQVAGQMGMAPESISRLMTKADEKHKITASRLQQFADVMGVTVNELRLPPRPKDDPKPISLDEMVKDDTEDEKLMYKAMTEAYRNRKSA